jgi:hypothetical protein
MWSVQPQAQHQVGHREDSQHGDLTAQRQALAALGVYLDDGS